MSEVELRSQVGADYTKLRDLLAAGNWKEADRETADVMLKVGGDPNGWYDCLLDREIESFPHTDLHTIDQLWVHYSSGRFGFSVQLKICQEVGFDTSEFMRRVGWSLEYWDMNWERGLEAPVGYLPRAVMRQAIDRDAVDWIDAPGNFLSRIRNRLSP